LTFSFDKDDTQQNQKLDEMDLDDILNRAEDHETMAQAAETGASLGGEGFLQQFANISDIRNDMSWEDIIPLEERQKFEQLEAEAREDELSQTRKRTAANINYEGMDVDQPTPTSSKPKSKNPAKPSAPRKSAAQRSLELKERDVRVLIRSLQRWGDIRLRYDTIVGTRFGFITALFISFLASV
jgi:chromodomain-helicase-DNA-binding protein 1